MTRTGSLSHNGDPPPPHESTDAAHARDRRIVVLAALDTKAEEALFLANSIRENGCASWLVDTGFGGQPRIGGDTARSEVAAAAGVTLGQLSVMSRGDAIGAVVAGVANVIRAQLDAEKAHGVIAVGGGTGTTIAAAVMRPLPTAFPKVIVSTVGGARMAEHIAATDIAYFPSITDIAGVNSILAPILANAAAAVCAMAARPNIEQRKAKLTIALSMFGVTTAGGDHVRQVLAPREVETVVFHANGIGGRAMEELIAQRRFDGVLDWTTTEITDEVVGGRATAGPARLEAAGRLGLPQVVVPGAVDVVNIGAPEDLPKAYAQRTVHQHLPTALLMRTSAAESEEIGRFISSKLNAAIGPVRVMIPTGGFSSLDVAGGPFEDPEADRAFVKGLRQIAGPGVEIEEFPLHINDAVFAEAAANAILELCQRNQERPRR